MAKRSSAKISKQAKASKPSKNNGGSSNSDNVSANKSTGISEDPNNSQVEKPVRVTWSGDKKPKEKSTPNKKSAKRARKSSADMSMGNGAREGDNLEDLLDYDLDEEGI